MSEFPRYLRDGVDFVRYKRVINPCAMGAIDIMCLATAAIIVGGVGTAVGAVGAYQQGQAAKEAASFNAQVARNNQIVAEQNEQYAIQAGMQKAAMESMKGRAVLGRIKATQAASGIETGEGSALDVQQGAREANVLDTATVLHNAQLEAYGYRSQATNFQSQARLREMEGSQASAAGTTGALSTLLSGAGSLGSKWAGMNTPANDGTLSLADNLAKYGR